MHFNIGIDIGGTHTDAVLVNKLGQLQKSAKTKTTLDIATGVEEVLRLLLENTIPLDQISEVRIGTTHATNALLQAKGLSAVGLIRLTGKKEPLIPAAFGWPKELSSHLVKVVTIQGGFESDGRQRTPLNEEEADRAIAELLKADVQGIAIASCFAPLYPIHENQVASRVPVMIPVCCSSTVSGLGFIERENTAVLNLLLQNVLREGFSSLEQVLHRIGIYSPLFLTHNDGSLVSLQESIEKPILTLSSGQTNSFVGGAKLLGLQEAVVIDIGGTTTDIGVIHKGFPRKTLGNIDIGGIPLNFAMPDVLSVSIGGGSIIKNNQIGPQSCGSNLFEQAISFGGSLLTLTDIALRAENITISGTDPSKVPLTKKEALNLHYKAFTTIKNLAKKMQLTTNSAPIVVVGGGSFLFKDLFKKEGFILPKDGAVANAFGAALAEIRATLDTTVTLGGTEIIEDLKKQVIELAIKKGADPKTIRLTQLEILPYHYLKGKKARVIISAAGRNEK